MVFLSFGIVGAIKSPNSPKIIGLWLQSPFHSTKFNCLSKMEILISFFKFVAIRVVAIDMRGYNLSERPVGLQNYTFQYMVDDLRALIEHLSKCACIFNENSSHNSTWFLSYFPFAIIKSFKWFNVTRTVHFVVVVVVIMS